MVSSKIDTVIKAYCAACEGERNCEVAGHKSEGGDDDHYCWHRDWYLLACRGCDNIFAQSISTNSEDLSYDYGNGEEIREHVETIRMWPPRSRRRTPDWYPYGLRPNLATLPITSAMRELYGALDNDLNVFAGIGLRTVFDVAAEKLGISSDLTFEEKLDALTKANLVTDADREHLAVLVDAGSASAHRGWKPDNAELDTLVEILEGFISKTFVEPHRAKQTADKIAKLKSNVPPRPKRKKKVASSSAPPNFDDAHG